MPNVFPQSLAMSAIGCILGNMGELPFKSHEGRILQDGTARYEENSLKHRFVSSDRRECILFFNTEHGSFDKKRVFVHRLTGEDMENFYLAVGRQ